MFHKNLERERITAQREAVFKQHREACEHFLKKVPSIRIFNKWDLKLFQHQG